MKRTRMYSAVLALGLAVQLLVPAGQTWAQTNANQSAGSDLPVVETVPAANADTVRPDTRIELRLDTTDGKYEQWNRKFRNHEVTLALLTDQGQATYTSTDDELQYDPKTGTLIFTPPAPLHRYTTYGVVITPEKLPAALRADGTRKQLPPPAKRLVEAVTVEQGASEGPSVLAQQLPAPIQSTANGGHAWHSSSLAQLVSTIEHNRQLTDWQQRQSEFVGPPPKRAVELPHQPLDVRAGNVQQGMIKRVDGSTVVLFGDKQFQLTARTHVHIPAQPGREHPAHLQPGDLVTVTLNAASDVQNVNVKSDKGVHSFVFRTGSALHEPTQVRVEQAESRPRVTENGHFELVSTDDYGLPAWGSSTRISLATTNGSPLDASAGVLPSDSFVTQSSTGREAVTVVTHRPQPLVAKVAMEGPHGDGVGAHGFVVLFDFRPGLPATATLVAPETMEAGTSTTIGGTVNDRYGNRVEDGSSLQLVASAGQLPLTVLTMAGQYQAIFTAPTQVGAATLSLRAQEGVAEASRVVQIVPGQPALMKWDVPRQLEAGESVELNGSLQDRYGNPVADGTTVLFSATAGTYPATGTTTNGAFQLPYTAPTKVQTVNVAAASAQGTAAADRLIEVVAGPAAQLSLQAAANQLRTGEETALLGQASDQYGNVVSFAPVTLRAEQGTLLPPETQTNEAGLYRSLYRAPFYNGMDTVTAQAGKAHASLTLQISSAGTGYNPGTGEIEPVAKLVFDPLTHTAMPNQVLLLKGSAMNSAGQPLQDVVLSTVEATAGVVEGHSIKTDAQGQFVVTYRTQAAAGAATVQVTSGTLAGQTVINTMAAGYGYNPKTGQWDKVGRIEIDDVRYRVNREYNLTLQPGATVELTGRTLNEAGEPLEGVQFDKLTVTGGQMAATSSDANGQFLLTYQTPTVESNQIAQVGSGNALTTLNLTISRTGTGYNPQTRQFEPIAQIVFDPAEVEVFAGGAVELKGKALNANGVPLSLAKVFLTAEEGLISNQVVSGPDAQFTVTYLAPYTPGTYQVQGFVTRPDGVRVEGIAKVHVKPLPRPTLEAPQITLSGRGVGRYWSGQVAWSARVVQADGTPSVDELFVLDTAPYQFIDLAFSDATGLVSGGPVGVNVASAWTTYDPRVGTSYYAVLSFQMSAFDLNSMEYQAPSYRATYQVKW